MAFNQTEKQEKEYLKQIISFLKKVIGNTDASTRMRYAPCAKASYTILPWGKV